MKELIESEKSSEEIVNNLVESDFDLAKKVANVLKSKTDSSKFEIQVDGSPPFVLLFPKDGDDKGDPNNDGRKYPMLAYQFDEKALFLTKGPRDQGKKLWDGSNASSEKIGEAFITNLNKIS